MAIENQLNQHPESLIEGLVGSTFEEKVSNSHVRILLSIAQLCSE